MHHDRDCVLQALRSFAPNRTGHDRTLTVSSGICHIVETRLALLPCWVPPSPVAVRHRPPSSPPLSSRDKVRRRGGEGGLLFLRPADNLPLSGVPGSRQSGPLGVTPARDGLSCLGEGPRRADAAVGVFSSGAIEPTFCVPLLACFPSFLLLLLLLLPCLGYRPCHSSRGRRWTPPSAGSWAACDPAARAKSVTRPPRACANGNSSTSRPGLPPPPPSP